MSPPSSRPPAGIPSSGANAKYAIVAVLLVLAIGALFVWRTVSSRSAAAPVPAATVLMPPAEPTNPKIEDVPPPTPIEEKPEGGSGPRIIYVQAGGCEGKCAGTAPPELGQALQVRASQARRCYNEALGRDPSLRGHVTVAVRIGTAGNVCSVNVTSNDMGTPNVANCAANIFVKSGAFPSPHGGCVDATVPMSFVPQGQ
ncbi:MAG: AgmX/PglI C-terminal domain-containing protein [Myxococcota bacterium]|nr:AgmX/PglI C-terminal domain-containing protein [Myxococcota bacterium]